MTSAAKPSFPIVGIGASAGGLEALDLFLRNVPAGSGMGYVIVQHLDPTHQGMLAELLQRATAMPVAQVVDRTRVKPDHVYVIPPNKDMSIMHGVLHLFDPVLPRGLRLPIDYFFRSLAENSEERSIGVILSGMGSDGTLGLTAIKGHAGVVFVQDPTTAKFDGMPRSAVDAGLADIVARAEELPEKIIAYRSHVPREVLIIPGGGEAGTASLEKIMILLRKQTGHDFSLYKQNTIYRRIERRMGIHQIDRMTTYVRFLQENPHEIDLLFKELLIGVTSFFRDALAWEELTTKVIPQLLKDRPPHHPLRAWVAGCATGEEAYSLAIAFREAIEASKPPRLHSLQIFATDLDRDAIDKARVGQYPNNIAADVSPARLDRFFVHSDRGYQVSKSIREAVIFAPHNVTMDPPFTKLDLIACRNLLIYLTPELQNKLLPVFHYCLNSGGALFLGSSETIGPATDLFVPVDAKTRIYRRVDTLLRTRTIEFPSALTRARSSPAPRVQLSKASIQHDAEQLLLQRFAPAAVITDAKGDIVFISGRTGKYLEPAAGKTNWNVFAMAREGLRYELTESFRRAATQSGPVTRSNVKVGVNGGLQTIDLVVQIIQEPPTLKGMVVVVFQDVAPLAEAPPPVKGRAATNARVIALEQALAQAHHELQSSQEDMQSSHEELNSANEELQSANEELQSTNEELMTSKEEMQSMNEELQTLNRELQARLDDLSRVSNDMKNLLENTEIATVFLDTALHVRLFTAGSNRIFKLVSSDVGRPITDFASDLDYAALADDAREVFRTLTVHEQAAKARDGRWFQVRIMPYRTLTNTIDGVAITFTDITASKILEGKLRATQAGLERHIEDQAQQIVEAERRQHPDHPPTAAP